MRTYTGDKPYKCGMCGKEFSVGCKLKMHMRTHLLMMNLINVIHVIKRFV